MSRFFKGGSSSDEGSSEESEFYSESEFSEDSLESDESASDESESESDNSSDDSDEEAEKTVKKSGAARFMRGAESDDSDSEEDDVKRVVVSAKDKKIEEMRGCVKTINNALKISDWANVSNEYDKLLRLVIKNASGFGAVRAPRFFVRLLTELEDAVTSNKDQLKKMNALAAKGMTAMKQKLKKDSKTYEKELSNFRANPIDEEASQDERDAAAMLESDSEDEPIAPTSGDLDVEEGEDGFNVVGKGGKAIILTSEGFFTRLADLLAQRGKKNTDKVAQIKSLTDLSKHAKTSYQKIKVLLALLAALFDYIPASSGFMPIDMWKVALERLNEIHALFDENPHITTGSTPEDDSEPEHVRDVRVTRGDSYAICTNLGIFVDQLDDEFYKSLQSMTSATTEYIERLRDEPSLYAAILRAQHVLQQATDKNQQLFDLISMRRVEHLYFRSDSLIQSLEESARALVSGIQSQLAPVQPSTIVSELCSTLYKTSIDRIRTRALLCHVYHVALRGSYHEARDLLLMSHLPDNISLADIPTQVLYNRAMAQVGISAFRNGLFKDASLTLQDISASGKTKELLAQGMTPTKHHEPRSPEQEKQERARQLPFHMHINLDLLECIYLVSSMLYEIPSMSLHAHDARRHTISKSFRRMLDYSERNLFVGPPENNRDFIMAGARAMLSGEWKQCVDYVNSIGVWKLLPGVEDVKEMLSLKIQEESLRSYVFSCSKHYDSFKLAALATMFNLPLETVYSLIAKMIMNEEIHASLNTVPSGGASGSELESSVVVLHKPAVQSKLEYLAGVYADKVASLVDSNEKLLEARSIVLGLGLQEQAATNSTTSANNAALRKNNSQFNNSQFNNNSSRNMGFRFRNRGKSFSKGNTSTGAQEATASA